LTFHVLAGGAQHNRIEVKSGLTVRLYGQLTFLFPPTQLTKFCKVHAYLVHI